MKRLFRIAAFLSLVLLLAFPARAAETGNVDYTGNTGDIVFSAGGTETLTNLFADYTNVMPGAVLEQVITVRNHADSGVKVKIYLRSLGAADEDSESFLNLMHLTVQKVNETPFFDAPAGEVGALEDWKELGILYSGDSVDLLLTLSVPTSLGNEYQKNFGKLVWQFMAIEMPADEEAWVCPECGQSHYRVVTEDDLAVYVCEHCGHREHMICPDCGAGMCEVVYKTDTNKKWYYYECEDDCGHHTEPVPKTGYNAYTLLWIILALLALAAMVILLIKRKKK